MRLFHSSVAALMLVATILGASAEDRRFSDSDSYNQAIIAARATRDLFWKVASYQPCGCSGVFLYIQYAHNGQDAKLYITDVMRANDGTISGKVMPDSFLDHPELSEDLADVHVSFTDDDIYDWAFGRDGIWYGDFIGDTARIEVANISRVEKKSPKSAAEQEAEMREKFKAITLP